MITLLKNGCSLELIYPHYFRRCYYKHEFQKLKNESYSLSSEDTESIDAKSTSSSAAGESKSLSPEETVNFTEDPIPDKGGTGERSNGVTSSDKQSHCSSSSPSVVEEVVEESPRVIKPPPGFEGVRPNVNIQQTFIVTPPNVGYYPPIVQQNYFFPVYPCGFATQVPYNYLQPQQLPNQVDSVVAGYLNFLCNNVVTNTGSNETAPSEKVKSGSESAESTEVVVCGSLTQTPKGNSNVDVKENDKKPVPIKKEKTKKKKKKLKKRHVEKNSNIETAKDKETLKEHNQTNTISEHCNKTELNLNDNEGLKQRKTVVDESKQQLHAKSQPEEDTFEEKLTIVNTEEAKMLSEHEELKITFDNDFCLLDTDESELKTILNRSASRDDNNFLDSSVLETLLNDEPERISNCNTQDTKVKSNIIEKQGKLALIDFTIRLVRLFLPTVIAGKTINIVTWEQKRCVVFHEALMTYADCQLPVATTKVLLARRKIFLKDIDVDLIDEKLREEFMR